MRFSKNSLILITLIVQNFNLQNNAKPIVTYEPIDKNVTLWPKPSDLTANRPGSITVADRYNYPNAIEALKFLNIKALEINNLYQQVVVSGLRYFVEGTFQFKSDPRPLRCKLIVWLRPWVTTSDRNILQFSQCDKNAELAASLTSSQIKKINLNNFDQVLEALDILQKSNIDVKHKNIQIRSIYKQLISGTKYIYEAIFKNNKRKLISCTIEILNQPWNQTSQNRVLKNSCSDEFQHLDNTIHHLDPTSTNVKIAINIVKNSADIQKINKIIDAFGQKVGNEVRYFIRADLKLNEFENSKLCLMSISKLNKTYEYLQKVCD